MTTLRLGTRGSQLALFQARLAASRIEAAGGPASEIVVIKTSGDRLQEVTLSEVGGKRLFVKEIEDALLSEEIDLAVHSCKDMPAVLPDGLDVAAVLPREDPSDALILPRGMAMAELPPSARIGTGSVRRIAQLRALFPAATFHHVRGNLDTRLRKLDGGNYDLLVLASAGLRRLGLTERISMSLPVERCVPAPGQGIIALETRTADARTRRAVAAVNDCETFAAFEAERALVVGLGGGCQMPIGGIAQHVGDSLELLAIVASLDGGRAIRYKKVGARTAASALGREVANSLLAAGAAEILKDSRN